MDSKLILVDMDGTLTNEIAFSIEEVKACTPREDIISKVNELVLQNFIVIYTARRDELIPATLEWLRRNNVRYHAISNIKVPAQIYLDDKMIGFEEFKRL